jgi:hypothetical protein
MGILHHDYVIRHQPLMGQARDFAAQGLLATEDPTDVLKRMAAMGGGEIAYLASLGAVAMGDYYLQGQQVFRLGKGMGAMLARTELNGVPVDDIQLPYKAFWVDLAELNWPIWGGELTKDHRVEGMYVVTRRDRSGHGFIWLLIWGGPNERSTDKLDDAISWATLTLRPGLDAEAAVTELVSSPLRLDQTGSVAATAVEHLDRERTLTRQAFRVAFNLALYLASPDADVEVLPTPGEQELRDKLERVKSPSKRKVLERQLSQKRKQARITLVGPRIERTLAATVEQGDREGPRAHWVRGHWRTYWVGSGRSQQVRRWIKPFLRGAGEIEPDQTREYRFRDRGPE